MICKVEMPLIDPSLRGGHVVSWSKQIGDQITFGDEICIVALDEFAALRRTARATLLAGRKRKKLKSDVEVRAGKVFLEVALTSSDQGVLRKITKQEGDEIMIGDILGIVTTKVEEDPGQEIVWADAPALRVVANPVGDEENLEGGF